VRTQNRVFDEFAKELRHTIRVAKENGVFDAGVAELQVAAAPHACISLSLSMCADTLQLTAGYIVRVEV
jgi:hypothetical protein